MPSQSFPTDPPLSSRISALSDSLVSTPYGSIWNDVDMQPLPYINRFLRMRILLSGAISGLSLDKYQYRKAWCMPVCLPVKCPQIGDTWGI